jgi:hypothetical protein
MNKYFQQSLINSISSGVTVGIEKENIDTLVSVISKLNVEESLQTAELQKQRADNRLPDDHPIIVKLTSTINLLNGFSRMFDIVRQYLQDKEDFGLPTPYTLWAQEYNRTFSSTPLSIYQSISVSNSVDRTSFEYYAFVELKKKLDPLPNNNNTDVVRELYHVIDGTEEYLHISKTNMLPPSVALEGIYFFTDRETVKQFLQTYPRQEPYVRLAVCDVLFRIVKSSKIFPGFYYIENIYANKREYAVVKKIEDIKTQVVFGNAAIRKINRRVRRGRI